MSKRGRYKRSRKSLIDRKVIINSTKSPKVTQKSSFKESLKLAKKVNAKLSKLTESGYKSGTWATKKLRNRLQTTKLRGWHRGRVKIKKGLSETDYQAINKAMAQFLESKTSTPKGIKSQVKTTKEAIKNMLSDENKEKVTDEDAEFYFDMLGSDDFDYFAEKIGPSTLWILIDESIAQEDSQNDWISRLSNYITVNDEETRTRAIRLYNKYIGEERTYKSPNMFK